MSRGWGAGFDLCRFRCVLASLQLVIAHRPVPTLMLLCCLQAVEGLYQRVMAGEFGKPDASVLLPMVELCLNKTAALPPSRLDVLLGMAELGDFGKSVRQGTMNAVLARLSTADPPAVDACLRVFRGMQADVFGHSCRPNAISATHVLHAFSHVNPPLVGDAASFFTAMVKGDIPIRPSIFCVSELMYAYALSSPARVHDAEALLERLSNGGFGVDLRPNTTVLNLLLLAYDNASPCMAEEGTALLHSMAAGKFGPFAKPNTVSVNTLLSFLGKRTDAGEGDFESALKWFGRGSSASVQPDGKTLGLLTLAWHSNSASLAANPDKLKEWVVRLVAAGARPNDYFWDIVAQVVPSQEIALRAAVSSAGATAPRGRA